MDMAEVAAKRSVCYRGGVAALIVEDRDILSQGFNGPGPGEPHCEGHLCEKGENGMCLRSIHAEKNAITRAMRKRKKDLTSCEMYCTWSPCDLCARAIIASGIRTLYYRNTFRSRIGLDELLTYPTFKVFRITPSGIITNEHTGVVVP